MQAAQLVRSTRGRTTDPKDLFSVHHSSGPMEMRFAAEMLVSRTVEDDFGREAHVTSTFLRYELHLGYESANSSFGSLGRLVLLHESLDPISKGDSNIHIPWASKTFRDAVVVNRRRSPSGFISTEVNSEGVRTINVHQDGGSRGRPQPSPANSAPRTIVCTTNTASEATILAARREMQAWRSVSLEPTAMRSPDEFSDPSTLSSDGAHMAATLYRLATQPSPGLDSPELSAEERMVRVYASIANRLSSLIDAREIRIDRDDKRELLTLELKVGTGGFFPARSLSDGTLRFLALSILDADASVGGVVTMEEPENGIHPERLGAMVSLIRGISVDPEEAPGAENPFRQVIVNTHSPGVVQLQSDEDLLLARSVAMSVGDGHANVLRLRPSRDSWRAGRESASVGRGELLAYLTEPKGAQLKLLASRASDAD